jgi:hypothetical protein
MSQYILEQVFAFDHLLYAKNLHIYSEHLQNNKIPNKGIVFLWKAFQDIKRREKKLH